MIHIEESIIINRPIEEVFAYVSNHGNASQWQAGVLESRQTPDSPVGVGTRFTGVRTFLGRNIESTGEFIEYEPPTKYAYKLTSGPPMTGVNFFEPTAEGTKVTITFEMQVAGLFTLAEPLVGRSIRRALQGDLGTLQDLLESRAGGSSS